jgi:hypothetical protein
MVSAKTTHLAACAFVVGLAILLVARGEFDGIALAMLLFALLGVRGIAAEGPIRVLRLRDKLRVRRSEPV